MRQIDWRHNRRQLFLPVAVMPSAHAPNAMHSVTVKALIDTGATRSGLHKDLVDQLALPKRDRAPVQTANGTMIVDLHQVRLGFWQTTLDHDLHSISSTTMPFILDRLFLIHALGADFSHQMLIGMDVIGMCDLTIRSDGVARLVLP